MLDKYKQAISIAANTGTTAGFAALHNPTATGATANITGRFNDDNTTVDIRINSGETIPLSVKYVKSTIALVGLR